MSIAARFEIHYSRFLDEHGKAVQPLPAFARDAKALVSLYRWMVLMRAYDAKAIALQRTGQLGTFASLLGQEAINAGIGSAMSKDDVLLMTYRENGAQLMRGVELKELFLYWGGDERGCDTTGARMGGVCGDGDANRKIPARAGGVASALVAAPVEKQLLQLDPAHQLSAVFPVGHEQHVVLAHRRADTGVDGLLAQQGGESAELAGALQRDRLRVVGAHQHHPAIQRDEGFCVARERRQRLHGLAVLVQETGVVDLEAGSDGHEGCRGRLLC